MNNYENESVNRRGFLKLAGAGLGGFLVAPPGRARAAGRTLDEVAILYDASLCIGCRACEEACKEYNRLPSEPTPSTALSAVNWNLIQQRQGRSGRSSVLQLPVHALHRRCLCDGLPDRGPP